MKNQLIKSFGIILFCITFLLGATYNTIAFWRDLEGMSFWGYPESTSFDSKIETDGRLHHLICPVLLTSSETASVKIKVSNPKDYPINPAIQANLSNPGEPDNLIRNKQTLSLEPGQTVELSWQVGKSNILFGRVIFVRIYFFQSAYHPPSATAHCGIMVRDFGNLNSSQLSLLVIVVSIAGMMIGSLIWWWAARSSVLNLNKIRSMLLWLITLTITTVIANFLGSMLMAGLLVLLTILSVLAIIEALLLNRG